MGEACAQEELNRPHSKSLFYVCRSKCPREKRQPAQMKLGEQGGSNEAVEVQLFAQAFRAESHPVIIERAVNLTSSMPKQP